MLGIIPPVLLQHYERVGQAQAAKSFDRLISQLQADAVMRQAYKRTRPRFMPVE